MFYNIYVDWWVWQGASYRNGKKGVGWRDPDRGNSTAMCLRKWKSTGVGAMEAGLSSQSMQKGTPPEGRVGGRKKSAGRLL